MKSGISLVEMAQEIQRQNDLKADYMLDTRSLRLEPFGGGLYLNAYDQSGDYAVEPLEVNAIAHRQIGTHLKIPAAYYDKMLEEWPGRWRYAVSRPRRGSRRPLPIPCRSHPAGP